MKKLYVVLAALIIASMVLTACGKAPTAAPATQVPTEKFTALFRSNSHTNTTAGSARERMGF